MAAPEIYREYGYVILMLVFYSFLNFWMASRVVKDRKKYEVSYTSPYTIETENKNLNLLNCIQSDHQTSVEQKTVFFALLLIGGLQHPRLSACFAASHVTALYLHFRGSPKICGIGVVPLMELASFTGLVTCTASFAIAIFFS
ncbi:hypothetical protein HPP92_009239 [Vanilla planifolia]|uniref:Glutathione transferase n=1 Tax=Vanilla planifolia TaxID=51239 RepID=A0A835R9X9_VANPL|nr:hypothetical protein HPP92_009239 [Vanilla planifolia]